MNKLLGVWGVVVVVGIGGWIANVVKLIGMLGGEITAMFVARCVGVFAAPLGAILGFF
jgi:hypothetical protein